MNNVRKFASASLLLCAFALGAIAVNAANAREMAFVAALSGGAEVPAVASAGSGTLTGTLDAARTTLTWRVTYRDLSGPVVAAHFHGPAAAGENNDVVIPLSGALTSPISGVSKLTPAQADDLVAGKWYLNLHTAAHPGGEVRGQLAQEH